VTAALHALGAIGYVAEAKRALDNDRPEAQGVFAYQESGDVTRIQVRVND
jgi:hypothetical protein